jgi:hypothetical protein
VTAIAYPTSLPGPGQWVTVARERRAQSQGDGVKSAPRARSVDRIADIEARWVYSPDEMAVWVPWYEDTLLDGTRWFAVTAPGPGGHLVRVCRFRARTVRRERLGGGNWAVSALLEQRGRSALPQVEVCFLEDFAALSPPYSTVGGSGLARYELVSSPYGSALRYIGGTSFVDNSIARSVPSADFGRWSLYVLVETASFDNAAHVYLRDSGDVVRASFRAREDTFVDAANRAWLEMGGVSTYIGSAAIATGVWHRLEASLAGAYSLTRLDTMAVVGSGTLSPADASYVIDSLLFVEDSNGGSTATRFADIEICPPD